MDAFFLSGTVERQTLNIADTAIELTVERSVPVGARKLIWEEFFASRCRGSDWTTHLPWTEMKTALCAFAVVDAEVVATLLGHRALDAATAMIGYVCVHPGFRGLGLSRRLIDLAAAPLGRLGVERMLLWTSKPRAYESSGFAIVAQERQLTLYSRAAQLRDSATLLPWPDGKAWAGVPPFATSGWQANSLAARIVFVDTPLGPALLDHAGAPEEVLALMFAIRPGAWSATLGINDLLRHRATANGACTEDKPGPVTMVRLLGDNTTLPAYVPPAFRI